MIVDTNFFMSDRWNLQKDIKSGDVVMISGGFDLLHIGHIKYILESAKIGDLLIAVVNGDGFLKRKKKYNFMEEFERATIVDNIKGVDYTIIWDDGTQLVDGALRLIKPDIFSKGYGIKTIPTQEIKTCKELNIRIIDNVGGAKIHSSTELAENMIKLQNQS